MILACDIEPLGTDQFNGQVATGDDSHETSQPQNRPIAQTIRRPCKISRLRKVAIGRSCRMLRGRDIGAGIERNQMLYTAGMSSAFDGLDSVPDAVLHRRRERVFLVMAGLFLGTLAMLNMLGISRFIVLASHSGGTGLQLGQSLPEGVIGLTFAVAVGVLPYPMTFLCTDLISEFYGRRRANFVVWVGLILNLWVIFILWIGGILPGSDSPAFFEIRKLAFGAVLASMIAYLAAQFVDVHLFHFWKRLTKGKHLWLRNNGSTLASQAVDTVAVILITYQVGGLDFMINEQTHVPTMLTTLILTGYVFKLIIALLDTPVIYLAVAVLRRYLRLDPVSEHEADAEEISLYATQD